jgi:hypothetical protein
VAVGRGGNTLTDCWNKKCFDDFFYLASDILKKSFDKFIVHLSIIVHVPDTVLLNCVLMWLYCGYFLTIIWLLCYFALFVAKAFVFRFIWCLRFDIVVFLIRMDTGLLFGCDGWKAQWKLFPVSSSLELG